ncbi:g3216 [Coccomyxa elongata]
MSIDTWQAMTCRGISMFHLDIDVHQDQKLPGWEEITVANLSTFLTHRPQLKAVRGGDDQFAALEAEINLLKMTQPLSVALRDRVFRYSLSNITWGSNKKFRQRLQAVYGAEQNGLLCCMLTGEKLPVSTVIASHLYKCEWKEFAEVDMGLEDIDDVGNGLLMWKPIEHAFNTSALCFVHDKGMDRFVAHVLDLSLLDVSLSARGAKLMGASWVASPPGSRAASLTYRDIDGEALRFPPNCLQRPLKRVLCYQAHLAKKEASKQGWRQLEFEDFWSEGLPYLEKVKAWLAM